MSTDPDTESAEDAVEVVAEPAPLEPPPDYEKAFHEMFSHAELLQNSVADLTHERDDLKSTIEALHETVSDLESQVKTGEAAITEVDVLTSQLEAATAELATLRAQAAEVARQKTALKLYGARVNGDKSDRMILAESAAQAAGKLPTDAERLVLVTTSLTW